MLWPVGLPRPTRLARGLGAFHGARPTPRVPIVRRNRTKCLGDPQWYRTPHGSYRMTAFFDAVTPRWGSDLLRVETSACGCIMLASTKAERSPSASNVKEVPWVIPQKTLPLPA